MQCIYVFAFVGFICFFAKGFCAAAAALLKSHGVLFHLNKSSELLFWPSNYSINIQADICNYL